MSAITDDEIALLEMDMRDVKALQSVTTESLIARIRSDAAKIAEIEKTLATVRNAYELSLLELAAYDAEILKLRATHRCAKCDATISYGEPCPWCLQDDNRTSAMKRMQAEIEELRGQFDAKHAKLVEVADRSRAKDATIARLRDVAERAREMMSWDWTSHVDGTRHGDELLADGEHLDIALSALAPVDLGGEGS